MTLNQYQQAVVDAKANGPQVIEACPGSGKTYTLENLVAELVKSGADPLRIGIFTFSTKAASEMRWRIARALWPDADQTTLDFFAEPKGEYSTAFSAQWIADDPARSMLVNWTCTIHALSYRLLNAWYKSQSARRPRVLSGKDQWEADSIIKDGLDELKWKEGPKSIKHWISKAITHLVQPHQAAAWYKEQLPTDCIHNAEKLAELYRRYYDFCKSRNLIDFDMMQARVVYLLENVQEFRNWVADQFDYVLVDEAQDTSAQQASILFALSIKSQNIVFCGDVDQSMYKFRGAQPTVLREDFENAWPNVTRFNLPINYRSTCAIVNASSHLITANYTGSDDKYLKPFQSRPDAPMGEAIHYVEYENFDALTDATTGLIKNSGVPGDWFILSRTRAECAALHTALIAANVPAINKSGGLLFGAPHIRKVLAYARLACDYQNARNDLEILGEIASVATADFRAPWTRRRHIDGCRNTQSWKNCGCPIIAEADHDYSHVRFYGKKHIQKAGGWQGIVKQQYEKNKGGFATSSAKASKDLVQFVTRLEHRHSGNAADCLRVILKDCVIPWLAASEGLTDEDLAENGKMEDFDVLLSLAGDGITTAEFLTKVDELSSGCSGDEERESVVLGTIHWSKGAERKRVMLNMTRLPITPPQRKKGQLPTGSAPSAQEERRLAYVGITRAKDECVLMAARKWNGVAVARSQFVDELTGEIVQ